MLKYATHAQRKCNIANNHTSQPKLDTCILIQKQAPHRLSKLSFKVGVPPHISTTPHMPKGLTYAWQIQNFIPQNEIPLQRP